MLRQVVLRVLLSIEFFCGSANWSCKLSETSNGNWQCTTVDVEPSPGRMFPQRRHCVSDLSLESNVARFEAELRQGRYDAVHFGTECRTFSRGTKPPFRTNKFLDGLPGLTKDKHAIAVTGNRLVNTTIRLWWAGQYGARMKRKRVAMSWGNPATSMMWLVRGARAIMQECDELEHCSNVVTAYCRDGRPYRKNTRILAT